MNQDHIKKISLTICFIAMGIILSPISFPMGGAKIFPAQHFINIIAAIMLGPIFSTGIAGAIGAIRVSIGTGSLFAFPGGMIGALLGGITYKLTKNEWLVIPAEIIGTGLIAPWVSSVFFAPLMGKNLGYLTLMPGFAMSAIAGAALAAVTILGLKKTRVFV